jgi:hypothetical protein
MQKSGQVLVAAAPVLEYGFTDIDEQQPRPLTLQEVWYSRQAFDEIDAGNQI